MLTDSEIRKKYEVLYRRLKSEGIEYLERSGIRDDVKQEIISIIRNLPHPKVASMFDIEDVCRECSAGKLEYLFELFGSYARQLRQEIQESHPGERREELLLPPDTKTEEGSLQDIIRMMRWSNEALFRSYHILTRVSEAADIILKAQCPYCMGDLVEVIVGNELRLRCKSQAKSQCRTVDWHIGTVAKRPPP
jgi:hypothetical protein